MSTTELDNIVVIGGGILGVSTAAHLARSGASVTLVTKGALGDGASGRSIAWLNSSGSRSAAYHYLRVLGVDRYRTWSARHPESQEYVRFDGALKWAAPGESLVDTYEFERAGGYDARWVDRDQIAKLAPEVNLDVVADEGAIYNPGEGWVNMPELIGALATEARADGATIIEQAGEVRVGVSGARVASVILGDGSAIAAERVVLATGSAVPAQLAKLGVTVPDATPAAFVVFTDPVDFEMRTVLNTPRVAVRPSPDGSLVLDADWAEQSVIVDDDGLITVPDWTVRGLLEAASTVLAGGPPLSAHRVSAGLKPIPGDGEPVAGVVPGVAGLFAVFTHSGATLGLILGELMAEEVLTGRRSPVLAEFGLDRFARYDKSAAVETGTGAWSPVPQR